MIGHLVQFPGTAVRRTRHFVGLMESRIVHVEAIGLLQDHGLEAVTPQDLPG